MAERNYTKSDVMKWAKDNEVEVSIDPRRNGSVWHVHANIDADHKIFELEGLHNLSLWDSDEPPNWDVIMRTLLEANLADCDDPDCEYCNPEPECVGPCPGPNCVA